MLDNGLSRKGKKQADQAAKHFLQEHGRTKALVLSSPKRRCIETVQPIADKIKKAVEISPLLDQQGIVPPETSSQLEGRAKEFQRWWRAEGPELTVICSHGDWIPLFLCAATGANVDLAKGGWAEIRLGEAGPVLVWLFQNFDF
jgi:broad specificity phosphatase PhoE